MIGIRSAISIRARGHRPHLEAVYMTAPRSVRRNTKKPLPKGSRPYMTRSQILYSKFQTAKFPRSRGAGASEVCKIPRELREGDGAAGGARGLARHPWRR